MVTNVGLGMNVSEILSTVSGSDELRRRAIHCSLITAAVEIDGAQLI